MATARAFSLCWRTRTCRVRRLRDRSAAISGASIWPRLLRKAATGLASSALDMKAPAVKSLWPKILADRGAADAAGRCNLSIT